MANVTNIYLGKQYKGITSEASYVSTKSDLNYYFQIKLLQ